MRVNRAERKFKRALQEEPNICIVITPAGNWKIPTPQFPMLIRLAPFIRIGKRLAKLRDEFKIQITDDGFFAEHKVRPKVSARIFTIAQLLQRESPQTQEDREADIRRSYGLQWTFDKLI